MRSNLVSHSRIDDGLFNILFIDLLKLTLCWFSILRPCRCDVSFTIFRFKYSIITSHYELRLIDSGAWFSYMLIHSSTLKCHCASFDLPLYQHCLEALTIISSVEIIRSFCYLDDFLNGSFSAGILILSKYMILEVFLICSATDEFVSFFVTAFSLIFSDVSAAICLTQVGFITIFARDFVHGVIFATFIFGLEFGKIFSIVLSVVNITRSCSLVTLC